MDRDTIREHYRRANQYRKLAFIERPPGTEVAVVWGGFSDEPSATIRARVHALPFITQHRREAP